MLSPAEVAAMRETTEEALPDLCTIERNTPTNDGGDRTDLFSPLATDVACRIAPIAGGEAATGGRTLGATGDRADDETTHQLTLPWGQDITEADQVVVDGQTYEVTLVRKRGEWELSRIAEMREKP